MKLTDELAKHLRIDTAHQKALRKLSINTVEDLLYHLPTRYEDISQIQSIAGVQKGDVAVVYGKLTGLKSRKAWKSKRPIAEGYVEDGSAKMKVMWFNQPYIAKMYSEGVYVKLAGTVSGSEKNLYISNPEIEHLDSLPIDRHDSIFANTTNPDETLYPVYKESKGITSKWIYHTILKCFQKGVLEDVVDPIPATILDRYKLPELSKAFLYIHSPKKQEYTEVARKRFAFEEVFYIQIQNALNRAKANAVSSYTFKTNKAHVKEFTDRFPFSLTKAQNNSIATIIKDFGGTHAMSRLLEGDVGSGKTAVAATTAYVVATSRPPEGMREEEKGSQVAFGNLQVAYMAPTEILARQHFESFIEYFQHLPIQIGLITGSGCMKFPSKSDSKQPTKISRAQLLKWVKSGEIPILIGTHALIYKSVEFKHLAYVIIDEQHRFGTNQRKQLAKKDDRIPHLLSMTATPIPRTLALTLYGDLDITLLDEMPKGRKQIKTSIIGPNDTKKMYDHVRDELKAGRQAYVICPRIDEPDPDKQSAVQAKSVTAEAKRLGKEEFSEYRIGILHGKMKPAEKEATMQAFLDHSYDVLVATSVVEVGVNVPNASNIIIEGAERFGLAQLHQLRGRVLRGIHQPYCFTVTNSKSDKTKERLKALTTAKNGFELAEYDLQFRGTGELYGGKQSGLSDIGMEALRNLKLVEAAREEAQNIVLEDSTLTQHPRLQKQLQKINTNLHLE